MTATVSPLRRRIVLGLAAAPVALRPWRFLFAQIQEPLPSWNDSAPKRAILDFVAQVTREGPGFVKPGRYSERPMAARVRDAEHARCGSRRVDDVPRDT